MSHIDIKIRVKNQRLAVAYHQHKVLYLIKPQNNACRRMMIYSPNGLMICTALRALMIYQACGLDKKEATFDRQKLLLFWHAKRDSNPRPSGS